MLEVQFGLVLGGRSVIRSRRGDCLEAINHRSPFKDAARDTYTIRRLEKSCGKLGMLVHPARSSSVYDNFGARFMADLVSFGGLSDSQLP